MGDPSEAFLALPYHWGAAHHDMDQLRALMDPVMAHIKRRLEERGFDIPYDWFEGAVPRKLDQIPFDGGHGAKLLITKSETTQTRLLRKPRDRALVGDELAKEIKSALEGIELPTPRRVLEAVRDIRFPHPETHLIVFDDQGSPHTHKLTKGEQQERRLP